MEEPGTPPPPPPPLHTSPTTASTTPAAFRSARQDELDALRSKGLAKIFNRHFTDTTERITAEREAAEVALNEIVARKAKLAANPKSFDKGGLTLTQLDALQMELKKRKQSVQRKERETIELYRRYVSQYGSNEQVARKALAKHGSPNTGGGTTVMNNSITGMKNTMPILHENRDYDIVRQTDLETARAKEKKKCVGVGSSTAPKFEDGSFNDSKYVSHSPNNPVVKLSKKESSIQPPQIPILDMDSPGVVASSSSSTTNQPQDRTSTPNDVLDAIPVSPDSNSLGNISGLDSTFMGGIMVGPGNDDGCDTDEDSAMSGLTSIDAATVAIAEYKLTEFLREETENIRKMLRGEEEESSEYDDELSDLGTLNTSTSLESQRAINAAKKAEDLAKEMEKQTAWMNNPSLLEDSDEDDGEKSLPPKAQWVAYYSEEQKKVYYCNTETNESRWTEPRDVEIDKTALEKINLPKDDSCGDEDMVVVKDYTKSDPIDAQPQHRSMSENLAQINRFRPDSDALSIGSGDVSKTSRASKVLAYKRKRRLQKRRRNRVIVAAFTMCSLFGVGVYKSREQWMPVIGLQTARQKAIEEETILKEKAAFEAEQVRKENMRKEDEEKRKKLLEEKELKKAELEAKKKAEKERKETERIAREKAEQERIEAKLAAQKEAEEKRIEAELAAKKKAEEKRIEAELAAKKKAEEARIKAEIAEQKKAEEARIKAEIAEQKKAEEARIKAEKEAKRKADIAAKKKAEEERIAADLLAKKKAEEERIAADLLAKKKAEQERIEAAKKAEEERILAEKKVEEEKLRLAKLKAEEEKRKQEAEALKEKEIREDERRKIEEEIRKQKLEDSLALISKKKKKNLCNVPFSVYLVKECKVKSRKKPLFDLKALVETMLE